MTRKQVQDQITLNMNDARTKTITQILNSLDIVMRYMVMKLQLSSHIYESFIRTTSGRMQYALNPELHQVQGNFYIPESNTVLDTIGVDDFNALDPSPDSTSIPYVSMLPASFPVKQQPHSKLRLVSDSASDTQAVTVHGQSYGRYLSEAVTLTGATAVLTTKEYQKVYRLIAATAAVGTITVTASSSAGDTALPTVAGAGSVTVGTILAAATESANVISPGGLIRIAMSADNAGDRGGLSEGLRIEGLVIDTTNNTDACEHSETILVNQSDTTTEVQSGQRYIEVWRMSTNWAANATMNIWTDPGKMFVADIHNRQRSTLYPQARFYNVPDGKTIQYRYTQGYTKLSDDGDDLTNVVPELYHQLIAEWTEKLVRGIHGDNKLGIGSLENNPHFESAVRNIKMSSRPATSTKIVMGSSWSQGNGRRHDRVFPIVHSTN